MPTKNLPPRAKSTKVTEVRYSYLDTQFADAEPILEDIRKLLKIGDFTLGRPVQEFENQFARYTGAQYAIGVANGTDALFLILKALGIGLGDEVITPPNSFIATTGAIVMSGAKPVFVDAGPDYTIDPSRSEER